jgi:hypothetical protein
VVLPRPGNFFGNSGSLFESSGLSCEIYPKRLTTAQGGGAVGNFCENNGLSVVFTELYFLEVLSNAAPDPEEGVCRLSTKHHMEPGPSRFLAFVYFFGASLAGVSIRTVQVGPVVTGIYTGAVDGAAGTTVFL